MPQEIFPTAIIKAMIPYADTGTAHSLELLLQTDELHTRMGQARASFQEFRELLSMVGRKGGASARDAEQEEQGDYELSASELGSGELSGGIRSRGTGGQMDLEGMIQAVQAVCAPEDRQRLEQMLMLLRVRRFLYSSRDSSTMLEAFTAFLSPEQKKQMDEMLPFLSMMMEANSA